MEYKADLARETAKRAKAESNFVRKPHEGAHLTREEAQQAKAERDFDEDTQQNHGRNMKYEFSLRRGPANSAECNLVRKPNETTNRIWSI